MSTYLSKRFFTLASLFIIFGVAPFIEIKASDEVIVYQGKNVKVIVPKCPLAEGSVQIIPNETNINFSDWSKEILEEAHDLTLRVTAIWEKKGITNYLIFGKEDPKSLYIREIVPFKDEGNRLFKQFKVIWNITFGGNCTPIEPQEKIGNDLSSLLETEPSLVVSESAETIGDDPFCKSEVIDKQLIISGNYVNVLYNYAPIGLGEKKLHFLIVPKKHKIKFSDLSKEEYLEASLLSQKLIKHFKNKSAYIFNKTGEEAGQTVPHWHEHLVFTSSDTEDFIGKLTVLKNLLFRSSPLSDEQLKSSVEELKEELSNLNK